MKNQDSKRSEESMDKVKMSKQQTMKGLGIVNENIPKDGNSNTNCDRYSIGKNVISALHNEC